MSYFGTFLLTWLAVGFIVGVKKVYVKQIFDSERFKNTVEEFYEENGRNATSESIIEFVSNKKVFVAIATLLGFISLGAEIIDTYKDIRDWIKKRKVSK